MTEEIFQPTKVHCANCYEVFEDYSTICGQIKCKTCGYPIKVGPCQ